MGLYRTVGSELEEGRKGTALALSPESEELMETTGMENEADKHWLHLPSLAESTHSSCHTQTKQQRLTSDPDLIRNGLSSVAD